LCPILRSHVDDVAIKVTDLAHVKNDAVMTGNPQTWSFLNA